MTLEIRVVRIGKWASVGTPHAGKYFVEDEGMMGVEPYKRKQGSFETLEEAEEFKKALLGMDVILKEDSV